MSGRMKPENAVHELCVPDAVEGNGFVGVSEMERLRSDNDWLRAERFDLASLVVRMARRLKAARDGLGTRAGDAALERQASEYLQQKGLVSPSCKAMPTSKE